MPSISDALQMDYAQTLWVPTAYLVTIASILLIIGRVSDIFGKKKIYISGFAIFAVGSLLCSLAQSGEQLISFRVIQGIGASFIMTSGTALVSAAFPPGEQGRALGLNVMAVYLGLAIGPPLGGILTQSFGWHSIFLVNVPIAIITIALAVWKLNECEILDKKVSFDISGAIAICRRLDYYPAGIDTWKYRWMAFCKCPDFSYHFNSIICNVYPDRTEKRREWTI